MTHLLMFVCTWIDFTGCIKCKLGDVCNWKTLNTITPSIIYLQLHEFAKWCTHSHKAFKSCMYLFSNLLLFIKFTIYAIPPPKKNKNKNKTTAKTYRKCKHYLLYSNAWHNICMRNKMAWLTAILTRTLSAPKDKSLGTSASKWTPNISSLIGL